MSFIYYVFYSIKHDSQLRRSNKVRGPVLSTELTKLNYCLIGETLLSKKHKSSREIKTQLDNLLAAWRHLLQESSNRGRGLEEAQDILEFNNQVDKIEAWIRDKVILVPRT